MLHVLSRVTQTIITIQIHLYKDKFLRYFNDQDIWNKGRGLDLVVIIVMLRMLNHFDLIP